MTAAETTTSRPARTRRKDLKAKASKPVGLTRELVTPEGVDLRVTLGSAGERAGGFLLDAAAITAILVAMTIGCGLIGYVSKGFARATIGTIWLLGFFLLRNAWFLGFELGPRAATPGKRAFGLRVASRQGGRLSADAIFARNAMREIEVFLPLTFLIVQANGVDAAIAGFGLVWTGVFALFPFFNRDRLRVGDLVSGTWVVRDPRRLLQAELAQASTRQLESFAFTSLQLNAYGVAELQVLEEVLRKGDRRALRVVADRIRLRIGWTLGRDESDRAFLDAYYAGLRGRLEAGLLQGRRRRDKHDAP